MDPTDRPTGPGGPPKVETPTDTTDNATGAVPPSEPNVSSKSDIPTPIPPSIAKPKKTKEEKEAEKLKADLEAKRRAQSKLERQAKALREFGEAERKKKRRGERKRREEES